VPLEKAKDILKLLGDFKEGEYSRICPTTHFGYRKITIERPLRLNFQATPERIAWLSEERAFKNLAISKKKETKAKEGEEKQGRAVQEAILKVLNSLPKTVYKRRDEFLDLVKVAAKQNGIKIGASIQKAILSALSERDETAEICRDENGHPEADPELRDTENVPLSDNIEVFFEREVKPHVPDAWINNAIRDHKDGEVGKVGYEINFNRYFYKYTPPRALEEIEADIRKIEKDIVAMLKEITS